MDLIYVIFEVFILHGFKVIYILISAELVPFVWEVPKRANTRSPSLYTNKGNNETRLGVATKHNVAE